MHPDQDLSIFKDTGALLEGHFLLTSGLHSNQYFQCAKVLQHPGHCESLCSVIADHFRTHRIDVVVAPAMGGIVVAQEVGRQLGVRTIFAERKEGVMQIRRGFTIAAGERVLVCEDVVTTGGSVPHRARLHHRRFLNAGGCSPASRVSSIEVAARCGLTVHLKRLFPFSA